MEEGKPCPAGRQEEGGRRARVKAAPLDPQSAVAQPPASWGQQGKGGKRGKGKIFV